MTAVELNWQKIVKKAQCNAICGKLGIENSQGQALYLSVVFTTFTQQLSHPSDTLANRKCNTKIQSYWVLRPIWLQQPQNLSRTSVSTYNGTT